MIEHKIALIICWYGAYPWFFPYFIHSCTYNPTIDFYIITDNKDIIPNKPVNVIIIKKSIEQIKISALKKLGFAVNIDYPYKFNDFKPAYAFLFPEIIKGYHFWGYGDIDVIYGNIRNFITEEILQVHDVISVRHDFLPGAFSLYKNCEQINELFMKSKDYKKVFTEYKHYCFDETNFTYKAFAKGIPVEKIDSEIESMTHLVKKLHNQKVINAYFDFHVIEGLPGKIKWENGILTYKNTMEGILYHLIKLKKIYTPKTEVQKIPETFYISQTRIYF